MGSRCGIASAHSRPPVVPAIKGGLFHKIFERKRWGMKKWNLIGTIDFIIQDFECEAENKDEAFEKLLDMGLFDPAICAYKVEEYEANEE